MTGGQPDPAHHRPLRRASDAWVSISIFLQGHDHPGGGFIAGVLVAAAGAMYLLAFGVASVSHPLVAGVGRGPAGLRADRDGALLAGRSYMDNDMHFHLPISEYHLPTATFFDLGVMLIVLGTLMTIFVELAQEERR